jgi:nicotinate-nucleotide adenylyltransferase
VKLGLFGGTFNPIHCGHIKAAEQIIEKIGLDRICFIPSNIPPHKEEDYLAGSLHRYKMVELAISGKDKFCISDYEISKKQKCYTVDTLKHFKEKLPGDELYFIVGHDIFNPIETWKDYKKLFELASFIVLSRPGISDDNDELPLAIKDDFRYYKKESQIKFYKHKSSNLLIKTQIKGLEVSSSEIRELIKSKKPIKELVPLKVEQYILNNNLYA